MSIFFIQSNICLLQIIIIGLGNILCEDKIKMNVLLLCYYYTDYSPYYYYYYNNYLRGKNEIEP